MDQENKVNTNENANMGGGEPDNGSTGPVVGVIVILAIIILGGLYFWGQRGDDVMVDETDETMESIEIQSESDDLDSIEADLDATDVEGLDAQLNAS